MRHLTLATAALVVLAAAHGALAMTPPPTQTGPIPGVPEPASAAVFAAGAALVALALRRHRKR